MLYALVSFSEQIGPLNVFRYITFRTGGAIMTALLFVFLFGPAIIDLLGIKQGTSPPGQIVILLGITASTVLWAKWSNTHAWVVLAVLWMVASSSALDGTGRLNGNVVKPAMVLTAFVAVLVYLSGNSIAAAGLQIPHIPGVAELAIVCGAIVGAGFACLLRESNGCSMRW